MIQIFLSRSREANFHVSFSSRFQESEEKFLFLLSIVKTWKKFLCLFETYFSFSSRFSRFLRPISLSPLDFQDFLNQHFDNWSLSIICQNMLLSLYHLTTFTFTQLPKWFLTSSWHCVRQRLQKGKVFTTLIFCLLESLIYLPISLSLLETGQRNSRFLFLLSKLEKGIQVSLSPLETGQENSRFLFLLSRRGKGIRISLSPLECGEIVFKFLFLFSIGLFCISSMTGTWCLLWWLMIMKMIICHLAVDVYIDDYLSLGTAEDSHLPQERQPLPRCLNWI